MLAVMAQARFARSVHSFICELLMLTMPDIVKGNAFIRNDTDFCKRIDDAIRDATNPTASEGDYIRAIINASCSEMEGLCNLLKSACSFAGLERIAAEYKLEDPYKVVLEGRWTIDKLAEQVGDAYANYKENLDADKGTQMSLRIDPAIDKIDALESAADYLSWLDYITLDSTIQREDDRMAVDVALGVNGTELATADVYKDDELSAVCVPMVSESYMLFDLKTTNSGVMEVLNVIASADLSRDEVVNLIAKLLKAVTHELDSVDKERDSLEAQDVSQHCMVLHVTVTPKDKQQIVDAVKKVLQTDKGAKKIISALAEQTGEDEQDILDRIADFDPDIDEDGKLKMDVFVGLNGDSVGRTIKSDDSSLRYAAPVSFIKRVKGLEVEARSNDEAVFRAEGTLRADSGELKFFGAPEEGEDLEKLLEVEYSDLKIKGDDRSGSFEFKLGKGVSMFLRSNGSEISVPLDTVSGKGKFSGDKKSMESSLTLRLAETEIAKLSYEQKQTDKASVEAVTKTITAAQWQRQFDPTELIGTLISRLSDAGMPEDVMVDFLTNVVGIPRSAAKALIRQAA